MAEETGRELQGKVAIVTGAAVGIGNAGPQFAASTAYCQKGSRALWEYYPDEIAAETGAEETAAVAE